MPAFVSHPLLKENTLESRVYQEVLVARVLEKGNSLVVAPTALGKTVVGVLLAAHVLMQRPSEKVVFLSPTKPLAVQHQKSLQSFLNIENARVNCLTGTISPEERKLVWQESTVISATPQTIENDIINGTISFEDVGLLVIDEAHRATGEYSYVFIAQQYVKHARNPLVLALTASPGSTEEEIQDVCRNLFIKNIEVKTLQDTDVKSYTHDIEMEWVRVQLPPAFLTIRHDLKSFVREQILFLKKIGLGQGIIPNLYRKKDLLLLQVRIRKELAQNAREKPYLFQAASRVAALMKVTHAITLLESQGVRALNEYFEKMHAESLKPGSSKAVKMVMNDEEIQKALRLARTLKEQNIEHPKLKKLREILLAQFSLNPESRVIVFNHYRDSVKALADHLNGYAPIKAKRFVGQATREKDKGMSQKEQIQSIQLFKEGHYNTLVASSVAEEGLDIPSVDLVIFFEPVPSEIRLIQRRGRTGRKGKGKVIVLIAEKTMDEGMYWASKTKEKRMHETLHKLQGASAPALPQQTTLLGYPEELSEQVLVYCDHREQASGVVRTLKDHADVLIKVKQLEVGDFVLSDDIVVERKTVQDFLNSMLDGRLTQQLAYMASNYKAPLILLEGDARELFSTRNVHHSAVIGMLTSIAVDYRVPLLFTQGPEETAHYLYVIAKREQLGKEKNIRLRVGRKGFTLNEQQRFIIESLPSVGPTLAKSLLHHFKTIQRLANASTKELQNVEKIGEKKAKQIKDVFEKEFKET
ncbi:MAG: DEAD/DEAH box helicase [Candidatus Diapherotrites archaeon]|nr:DEAD/DEAH box helicase [Candidatus Diapherotrites archaeon]